MLTTIPSTLLLSLPSLKSPWNNPIHRRVWEDKLLSKFGPSDQPIPYSETVSTMNINVALELCKAEPRYATQWRRFAVWCAQGLIKHGVSQSSQGALDVALRYSIGQATRSELLGAREVAWESQEAKSWAKAYVLGKGHPHISKAHSHPLTVAGAAEWTIACACGDNRDVAHKTSFASHVTTWWAARQSHGDDMKATQELSLQHKTYADVFIQFCDHGTLPEVV